MSVCFNKFINPPQTQQGDAAYENTTCHCVWVNVMQKCHRDALDTDFTMYELKQVTLQGVKRTSPEKRRNVYLSDVYLLIIIILSLDGMLIGYRFKMLGTDDIKISSTVVTR